MIRTKVVGRTYEFGSHAAMPTGIQTAGKEILAGPVTVAGRLYGKDIEWKSPSVSLLRQEPGLAVLCGTLETEGVIISMSTKIEYDGLVRFDMAVTPYLGNMKGSDKTAGLEQLWVDIPLRPEYASLFTYWPLAGGELKVYEPINSGPVPADGLTFGFKPFLWLGWEEGGLSWFSESDRGWQPADPARAITVLPVDGHMVLRLHLLDSQPGGWAGHADSWYAPNPPVTFSFGLQATPVKPVVEDVLAHRIVHVSYYEPLDHMRMESHPHPDGKKGTVLDRIVASGANVVVMHEAWNGLQNYWLSDRADGVKATVKACHKRGLKIIPYFGYEMSTLAPEWAEMHDRVLVKHPDGRYEGGWQRYPPQRDYMVCYHSEWQEKWLSGIAWMMDEYGFDGLYMDGTIMPWACANAAHGCGYQQADGVRKSSFPIFALRGMMQRLYGIVTARGGIITAHQSSCCLTPTLEYCHTYWDGEHIGGAFKHDKNGRFPLEVFRAEFMGRNFGIQSEFLSGQPEAIAYTLLHNVTVRPGIGGMLGIVASIWKAFRAFGTSRATWLPYWRNGNAVKTDAPHVYVSAYVRNGRLLLVVANLAKETPTDARITLVPVATGHSGSFKSARDAVAGKPVQVKANTIAVSCEAMGWKLIEVN